MFWICLFFSFIQGIGAIKCIGYECGDLAKNECAIMNGRHCTLKGCSTNMICDFQISSKSSTCKTSIQSKLPGEYCKEKTECKTNNCKGSTCVGVDEGYPCKYDYDCNQRLFCDKKKGMCIRVNQEGELCDYMTPCDSGLTCNNSYCVKLGSIKLNEAAEVPEACETLHIRNKICTKGPRLVRQKSDSKEGPIKCMNACTYTYEDNKTFTTGCTCAKNANPSALCNPGSSEINIEDVLYFINLS